MNKRTASLLIIGIVICISMFIMHVPNGFSLEGWRLLGIMIPIVFVWATDAIPVGAASLLLLILVNVFGYADAKTVFSGFANHLTWLMMGAFALAVAMNESGLSKRISYLLLSKANGLWSLIGAGYLINVFMLAIPSSSARGGIIAPILNSVMDSVGKPMNSKFSRFVAHNFINATNAWTGIMFMTGGAANGVMISLYCQFSGATLSWLEWFAIMFVPMTVYTALLIAVCYFVNGKPEQELVEKIKDNAAIREAYKALGPMTANEKKVTVAFILAVILWAFGNVIHLQAGYAAIFVMCLLLLPGIGVLGPKSLNKLNWSIIILIGCVSGLGSILSQTGLAKSLSVLIFSPILDPFYSSFGIFGIALAVIIASAIAHVVLPSPNNVTLLTPILVTWGITAGLDPAIVLAFIGMLILVNDKAIFLAYQMPPYYVFLGMDITDPGQYNKLLMKMYPLVCVCMIICAYLIYAMIKITGFGA